MNTADKLMRLKNRKDLTTEALAAISEVPRGTINKILNGETRNPTMRTVQQLARALGCAPDELIGDDFTPNLAMALREDPLPEYPNVLKVIRRRVPLIGGGAGGRAVAEEAVEAVAIEDFECDFALRMDSPAMSGARVYEGDLAFVRRQDDVEDGEVACVVLAGEATLRRVYHMPGGLTLVAENPEYPPAVFTGVSRSRVKILGRAVGFLSRL